LTMLLAATGFAGEVNAPPCPNPGEVNAPPCTGTQLEADDPAQTTTVSSELEAVTIATVISEIQDLLTVF
jgi:hypothetical protein